MQTDRSVSHTGSRLSTSRRTPLGFRALLLKFACAGWCAFAAPQFLQATDKPRADSAESRDDDEQLRRTTAVTLNYCRAAFHRIKRCPSKRVLLEEQERILNNLDLNRVADAEVVKLYTAVLHEIGQTKILTKEREVIRGRYKREFRRKMIHNVVAFGAGVANGEYGKALRIGAGSWWDYRSMVWNRGLDLWQIEKKKIADITDKSSLFLDTFWKLTRKRSIPDRWLIRSNDLDRLDAAMRETDANVRLRVLNRMRPFMEFYPPYWYYVGRTQQQLGRMKEAARTYETLEAVGRGHFRNDELLAAGVANRAAIDDYLKRTAPEKTAARALAYSPDAWEVNLLCARVLRRRGRYTEAEDALLRNLDVKLETEQSLAALLTLYCETKNVRKLSERLGDANVVKTTPVPALLRCVPLLNTYAESADDAGATEIALKKSISRRLHETLSIRTDRHFGPDDLCIVATPQWQLSSARLVVTIGGRRLEKHQIESSADRQEARFKGVLDLGSLIKPVVFTGSLTVQIAYPNGTNVIVEVERSKMVATAGFADTFRITSMSVGTTRAPSRATPALSTPKPVDRRPQLAPRRTASPRGKAETTAPPASPDHSGPDLIPPPPKRRRR